jgi:hypothetical protein
MRIRRGDGCDARPALIAALWSDPLIDHECL